MRMERESPSFDRDPDYRVTQGAFPPETPVAPSMALPLKLPAGERATLQRSLHLGELAPLKPLAKSGGRRAESNDR